MTLRLVVLLTVVAFVVGELSSTPYRSHHTRQHGHGHARHHGHGHAGHHGHGHAVHHGHAGHHGHHGHRGHHGHHGTYQHVSHAKPDPPVPACAANTTKPWCLEDSEYPTYEVKHAAEHHYHYLLTLYADLVDLNTEISVERPNTLPEETYLCPSGTSYVRPLRAQNTDGKWRVIVNNIEVHYDTLTQTTRIEECLTAGSACPKVPECYVSKCLQKSIYHRFLVYDPYDLYFPFVIETFKLPASCACLLGAYTIDH